MFWFDCSPVKQKEEDGEIWVFHSAENFKNIFVMFQEIMGYLNMIKRYPGRIFMKFERDEGQAITSGGLRGLDEPPILTSFFETVININTQQ